MIAVPAYETENRRRAAAYVTQRLAGEPDVARELLEMLGLEEHAESVAP